MFEKVNPDHPDKVADRIAGALVDMAYAKQDNPRIAVEISQPWEIFENLLGETYGARGRKAD